MARETEQRLHVAARPDDGGAGYHHTMTLETAADGVGYLRRRPRTDIPDRDLVARWFADERRVLRAVARHVPLAPRLGPDDPGSARGAGGARGVRGARGAGDARGAAEGFLLRPIEGDVLQDRCPAPLRVPDATAADAVALLTSLSAIPLRALPGLPRGRGVLPTTEFLGVHLNRLAARYHRGPFGPLLDWLGVPPVPVPNRLVRARMTARPRSLVHGDAHRGNLVIARGGDAVVGLVDWELALVGDPLYEAASHVWLMRYPAAQRRDVLRHWRAALPAAHRAGWDEDLPVYLALEDIRSALVDAVRQADALRRAGAGSVPPGEPAVRIVDEALERARRHWPAGRARVDVQVALDKWLDGQAARGTYPREP